jgi:hypothetical protein
MRIEDHLQLHDIQVGFNQLFPALKVEFYAIEHHAGEGSPKRAQLAASCSLAEVRNVHREGELVIVPTMTVAELEAQFAKKYGLNAQVFRKSGNLWMQTTATDAWTLAEQNRKGGASQAHYAEKYDD